METGTKTNSHPFLAGGGEMGELTRNYNWATTELGTPDQWPRSLCTTLGILLHSAFPMFLFWGPDLICFYNDAYRPSLGETGKHPALAQRGAEVWPEIWEFIGPLIDQVTTSGESVYFEDQLIPIYRNGQLEDVYWTFSYGPAYGDTGQINGVFVTCIETTDGFRSRQQLRVSAQRFQNLVREASVGIIVLEGEELRVSIVNEAYARLIDRSREDLLGKQLFSVIPETEGVFRPILDGVRRTGEPLYLYSQPYFVEVDEVRKDGFLNLIYQPYREPDGRISGVMVLCQDVTPQVLAQRKLAESEARFRSLIAESPVATCLFVGPELIIDVANEQIIRFFGRGPSIVGKPARAVLTGQEGDAPAITLLTQVFTTGEPFTAIAAPASLTIDGVPGTYYFDLNLTPLRNAAGETYAVLQTATDVTEQVLSHRQLEESEARFRSLIAESPVATCLFVGPELIIDVANDLIIQYLGKTRSIVGMSYRKAVPELDGQGFFGIMDEVFTGGVPYQARAARADLVRNGVLSTGYFDYTYTPLRDAAENVYAILLTAVDVTEQVLSRQKLEETESGLRIAVEMAQLATWSVDAVTGELTYSDRLMEWLGHDSDEPSYRRVFPVLESSDQERVTRAIAWALNPQSDGVYDEIYTVTHPKTGKKRILHAQGKTVVDAAGTVRLNGVAQDITIQRELQLALEQAVQERTEELAATNEELAATNEELTASNEELMTSNDETAAANNELFEANQLLSRSNDNLEKFAYVASHDLQEPLRKIQSFGDLLKNQYADQLGEGVTYLERMQSAASRMSTLIRDLLTYSRIATQRETVGPVRLGDALTSVLTDLDLRIQETGATVTVRYMPVVQGDQPQLEQMFQNLLSNALKFHRPDLPPVVEISSQRIARADLPPSVKPVRPASDYYRIDVADNGIGFDEKYVDRIFQVFQRLSGRTQYAGTGIGLAICEKVATNHGGAITASSQPGQGATFSVYFPV